MVKLSHQYVVDKIWLVLSRKINMQNQEIIKIIDNLKGRKNYEQKKAIKLGFSSLYAYFEDKLLKEKNAAELKKKELEEVINTDKINKNQKKSCSCC